MLIILAFASETEREKFEAVYAKYRSLMLHRAYQILHDPQLAEDAVSEAMLRVYRNMEKIDNPDSPQCAAFVVTIAKNTALTILSKRKGSILDMPEREQGDDFDLEEHVLSQISAESIHRIVDSLGEELRGVFILKYSYDMAHKEIGRIMGITENNVTVRLHRAKKKLAEMLRKEGIESAR